MSSFDIAGTPANDDRATTANAAPDDATPMPQQPVSGTRLIISAAFGGGAGAASPAYVCVVKPAA